MRLIVGSQAFCVNSLAHWHGWKPYICQSGTNFTTATDNPLGALVSYEWHNYHHASAWLQEAQHCSLVSRIAGFPWSYSGSAFLTDTDDDRTSGTRFPWDYALAELGPLQQFNPVKVFIDVMATVHCFSCCRLTVELRFIGRVLNRLACML